MHAKAEKSPDQPLVVPKQDVIRAWSALEKVVISLRNMGSHFSTPDRDTPLSPERRAEMLAALDQFFSENLIHELGRARLDLGRHIPEEEAEEIADHQIAYWTSPELALVK